MAIQMGFGPNDFDLKTWRAVAAEFIATGLFVFVGCAAVVVVGSANDPASLVAIAIAHGLAIATMMAATSHISGGHLNPAVTFSAAMSGRMRVSTAVLYIGAQLIAAVFAALLLKGIVAGPVEGMLGANALSVYDPGHAQIGLLDTTFGDGAGTGLLLEGTLTFALVFVFFATAIDPKGPTQLAPLVVGLVFLMDVLVGAPMTGGSMNPARSFGPALVANEWADHWVYWLGPAIGGAVAALVYEYVFLMGREDAGAPA